MAMKKQYADDDLCKAWAYEAGSRGDLTAMHIAQYAIGLSRSHMVPKTIRTRKQARLAVQSWQDDVDAQKEGA
jgi:hypothetical protein